MDPAQYTYPSPLEGYEYHLPLPTTTNPDGKSLTNPPPTTLSTSYEFFTPPITNGERGGFDIHIYHNAANPAHVKFAQELHTRIRLEFPELRIYKFWDQPVGPHTMAMFEVNLFTPQQFGAFIPWLIINRGPLSALVHPNTDDELRDHTQRATWLGERVVVDTTLFYQIKKKPPAAAVEKKEEKKG